MNGRWMISLAVVGAVAFSACGVEDEVTGAKEPSSLREVEQEVYVDIGMPVASPAITGNLYNGTNEFNPSCGAAGTPDASFKWTAPQNNTYTFTTTGSSFDTILHIYPFDPVTATNALGCNDDATGTTASSLTLTLTQGTVLRIVVDSWNAPSTSAKGAYALNISSQTNICQTPPNSCYAATGTWNGSACSYAFIAAGTACNDGNSCTTGDTCNGAGVCGGQAMACTNTANVSVASCSSGACGINTCTTGWSNCDGAYNNGCEVNTRTSKTNCGACGNVCGSDESCSNGVCTPCELCNGSLCCAPNVCHPKPNFPEIEICN
ncbi:hypothetical protein [Pyxidicoccus caerfyrddinensis]|uniref:hypothetical protein n=1 Tax=Pyxidicoccus caerfyrddinensis TaxID=2709663 RepID=UPI0013D9FF33|nr:hypothetical protein [Pyxidicoccus caerfyrddinensis]